MFIPIIFERVFVHPKWLAGFPSPTVYTNQTTMSSEMSGCPDTKFANGCSLLFLASRRKGRWWYQWCLYSESFPANLQGKPLKIWVKHHWPPRKTDPHTHATLFVFQVLSFWSSKLVNLHTIKMKLLHISSDFQLPLPSKNGRFTSRLEFELLELLAHESSEEKTQVEGKIDEPRKKERVLLSIESWLFNRDSYFMVLLLNPQQIP